MMGPYGSETFQRATLPTNHSQLKVFKLVFNFPPNVPHKTMLGIFDILNFQFLTICFSKISNLPF